MEDLDVKQINDQVIRDIALKIEREGHLFYKQLSEIIPTPEVRQFLDHMAAEEIGHEQQFKKMLDKKSDQPYGWEDKPDVQELVVSIFQTDIFPSRETLEDPKNLFSNVTKALDFAIEAEMISIEFYELLGKYCTDMEAKTVLVMLEKAERDHLVYVTNLKKKYSS